MSTDALRPIDPALRLGAVHLAVSDLARSVDFYSRVLGLELISEGDEGAVLGGAHDRALLELTRLAHPSPVPRHSAGLFHVALLHPTRAALASTLMRIARAGWPVTGASDHGVSEAIYLDDPDGLGLEIYSDRPRAQWPRTSDGSRIAMFTAPLDIEDLLRTVPDPDGATAQIDPATVVGHVHLKVSDVERALAFYRDALGFALEASMPSAAFLGAGGYHHHFGLNSWQSSGAPPAPPTAPGLRLVELELSDAEALDALERRAASAPDGMHRDGDHVTMHDPDRHSLVVSHRLAQRPAPSPA